MADDDDRVRAAGPGWGRTLVMTPKRWRVPLYLAALMWLANTFKWASRSPYVVNVTPWYIAGSAVFVAIFFMLPAFRAGVLYAEWARSQGKAIWLLGERSKR